MSDKKDEKLDFDLGFLDDELPITKQTAQTKNKKKRQGGLGPSKWNWKVISIIGGVILVVIWIGSSDGNTPTSTYTSPSTNQVRSTSFEEDMVIIGEFSCSRYHYNRAVESSPSESEQQMDSALAFMEYRSNELERLWNEIEYSYVTDYSTQYEIDIYNADVEEYNSKLEDYQWDADALDSRVNRYNNQVETHNNYLVQNCFSRK